MNDVFIVLLDSITRQRSSYISDCDINTSGLIVSVLCFYSPTSSSTGFLLVVQEKSTDGVRRLLVNTTEPGKPQGPVTVQVAMGQAYQVTVFPVREELGILDSTVAYTMEIRLGEANNPIKCSLYSQCTFWLCMLRSLVCCKSVASLILRSSSPPWMQEVGRCDHDWHHGTGQKEVEIIILAWEKIRWQQLPILLQWLSWSCCAWLQPKDAMVASWCAWGGGGGGGGGDSPPKAPAPPPPPPPPPKILWLL